MKADYFVDAKGLACPMPLIKTRETMNELANGQILEVHTTDKGSVKNLSAWAKARGHKMLKHEQDQDIYKFWIQKGS